MKLIFLRVTAVSLWLAVFVIAMPRPVSAAACTWNGGTTDWHTATNWSCGTVPGNLDTVTIPSMANNPIISNHVTIAGLVINLGALLRVNDNINLTINGDVTVNGSIGNTNSLGVLYFNGSTFTNNGPISIYNVGFTGTGAQSIAGTGTWTGSYLTIASTSNLSLANAVTFGVGGITNGGTVSGSNVLRTQGSITLTQDGTFSAPLEIVSGTTLVSANSIATFDGAVTVDAGATLQVNTNKTLTANSNVIVNGTLSGNLAHLYFYGDTLTNNGTMSIYDVGFYRSGAQTLTGTGSWTGNYLTTTPGGTVTLGSDVTLAVGSLSVGGTFSLGNSRLTFSGSSWANQGSVTYSGTSSSMVFNGTSTLSGNGSWLFRAVTINASRTVNAGSTSLTMDGSFSVSGTFNGDTSTVTFVLAPVSSATVGGSGTSNFNHLVINASTKTLNISTGRTINVMGDFTKSAGAFGCNGGVCTLRFIGSGTSVLTTQNNHAFDIVIELGKSVVTASSFDLAGNLVANGSFTANSGTINLNGSTVQSLGATGTLVFNNLTINNSNGVTLNGNVTVSGTLALASGDLSTGANTLTMGLNATTTGNYDVVGSTSTVNSVCRNSFSGSGDNTYGSRYTVISGFATNPTSMCVRLLKQVPSNTGLHQVVARDYQLTMTGGSVTNGTVRLHYRDTADTSGGCGTDCPTTLANLKLWRWDTFPQTRWVLRDGTNLVSGDASYVEVTGVNDFSPWGIAQNGSPTAVTLSSFAAYEDNTANIPVWGAMLVGVVIGSTWLILRRRIKA